MLPKPFVALTRDGLVREVRAAYQTPYLTLERIVPRPQGGGTERISCRMHLHPLEHHALVNDLAEDPWGVPLVGTPDGSGACVGDPESPFHEYATTLPWWRILGHALIVRRPEHKSRIIRGNPEYLEEIAREILKDTPRYLRDWTELSLGILVCSSNAAVEDLLDTIDDNIVPMGRGSVWDLELRVELMENPAFMRSVRTPFLGE